MPDSVDISAATETAPWVWRAIAIVDVVDSVRLMLKSEADIVERWRGFVSVVCSELLAPNGGRLVKSLGDGMLLEFADEASALAVARAMQRRIVSFSQGRPADQCIEIRIGLHAAHVLIDPLDIFGTGVNIAARLGGLGGPGEIVMSDSFRAAVESKDPLDDVHDLGLCYVKSVEQPLHAYRTTAPGRPVPPSVASVGHLTAPPAAPLDQLLVPACVVMTPELASPTDESRIVAELLGDGIAARLTVHGNVRVISRWSARTLEASAMPGAVAWSAFRANYLIRGRLSGLGGRHVVSLELVDTATEQLIWAGRQVFEAADLLAPDEALTMAIAADIAGHVAIDRLHHSRTAILPTLSGNELQISAATLMFQAGAETQARSQLMLEHLIDRHPREPSPRAWSAMWYVQQVTRGFEHDPDRVAARAMDHVNRALDRDPSSALAHAMAGFVHCHLKRDLDAADDSLKQSVDANPSESWAWLFRSVVAAHRGQGEDAWDWATRAAMLSPLDPMRHYFEGLRSSAAVIAGRYSAAIELARRSLAVNPHHLPTLRALAVAQVHTDRLDDAAATVRAVLAVDPKFNLKDYVESAPVQGRAMRRQLAAALVSAGAPAG
jgi:class 3 adenylate cyclase/TolB-like protein/tetratricopeptide (TPR) repeat protein